MSHCKKQMISFFLTTKCNLCCRYCYNAKERNSIKEYTLPLEIAFAGIDWYFSNNDSRHIRFYGPGEPTQEFDAMQQITEYAKKHKNKGDIVTVEIQTNGVFTDPVREWILCNANIVWVSFDGMKEIQEYNRPLNPKYSDVFNGRTSAEVLEDNIKWFVENKDGHNFMVGARVTITEKNLCKQREMVDYFSNLGIKYIWTDPVFYEVGEVPVCKDYKKKQEYKFDMSGYVTKYLDAYKYAKEKGVFWGSFLTINFDGESPYHCRCCTPLVAPHLTPDGFVSACDMVVLGEEPHHMEPFIIGRWDYNAKSFNFNYSKIKTLEERKSTLMKHCKECFVNLHCGGCCLGETVNETGVLDGQNSQKCNAIRALYKKLGSCEPYDFLHP